MSARDEALPAVARARTLDSAGTWFWNFLKSELSPYPGRAWVVERMVISASIVMLLVMTFQIPNGFLGAIYTLFLSRENPNVTLVAGIRTAIVYCLAGVYTIIGVMTMIDDPLTHFLWIAISLFIAFYVISIVPDYFTAIGFGFTIAGAIPLWDQTTLTVNTRTEHTLWTVFSVVMGTAVTVVVEYVFRRVRPVTDLSLGIGTRLQAVEDLLRTIAAGQQSFKFKKEITLYSSVGTSRLRRMLVRSGYAPQFVAQMNAAIALLGRLMDLAASLQIARSAQFSVASEEDRERCLALASKISGLRDDLKQRRTPRLVEIPTQTQPSELPFLPEMERTVALIPHAFSSSDSPNDLPGAVAVEDDRQPLLAPDAFSSPRHLKFAMRGAAASTAAYFIYTSIDWPGLSTAVATCIITAMSTIGASRQKQFLRLAGALIGGFVFGMGAQVFVLPYLNSIAGFTLLFAIVTAISAWISTATPRLSYLGVQMALAFYLVNLQEFTIQTSLAIARDRVFGVLLGLLCMWLIFDRLWVKDALQEMEEAFCRNLQMLSELMEEPWKDDPKAATERLLQLRDQINNGFNTVKAQSDAVLFEFGPSRERKLRIRDDIRRWQPTLGTLLQVQITYAQYLLDTRLLTLPQPVAEAQRAFQENMASVMRVLADEIGRRPSRPAPDVQESAAKLRQEIQEHFGSPLAPRPADMITLTQNLASILAPLYRDIDAAFATFNKP